MADKQPSDTAQKARSTKEIEADLAATRERLARTVDELAFRASPEELKRQQVEKLKASAQRLVFDEHGDVRMDRLATALGVVAGVAVLLGLGRRVFYKG
jgi:hypothetical protein